MKSLITTTLLLFTLLAQGQILEDKCKPDKNFLPSATLEITSDWGFITQGGVTGQKIPLSFHFGVRAVQFGDVLIEKEMLHKTTSLAPRLEIGYRVLRGVHLNVGLSKTNDISITGYKEILPKIALYGRCLYDKEFVLGLGVKVVLYKY